MTKTSPTQITCAKSGVTTRCIIIGLALSAAHSCWIVYEETALGHFGVSFTTFTLVQSVIGVLFLLALLNSLLKRTLPALMLSPTEMMTIFSMMTLASVIAGFDLLQNLVPVLLWPFYYDPQGRDFGKFLPHIPSWFVPQNREVIQLFFIGGNDPWCFFRPSILRTWVIPMIFWMTFLFILSATMLCLASIMRRQWIEREKLSFPILELPLTLARENTAGAMLRRPLFLIGFIATAALLTMNCLAGLFPNVPSIHLNVINIGRIVFPSPPQSGMNPVYVAWWPYAIGLCYLVPLDISFSCWFFYILIRIAALLGTSLGWREPTAGSSPNQFPWFQDLTLGAWIAVFFYVMWGAKTHLYHVWRVALGKKEDEGEPKEPLPYRKAVIGAALGSSLLIAVAIAAGMNPLLAVLYFTIYLLAIVVMTRIYAQIAIPIFELAFFSTGTAMASLTGTSAISRQDALIITSFHWFNRCYRQHPMGHELETIVFADKLNQRPRPMVYIIVAALITGIIVGMITTLQIYYDRGAASAKVIGAQIGVGMEAWTNFTSMTRDPHPPQPRTLLTVASSALVVLLLVIARNTWFQFPIHPIGYALACSYAMEYIWAVMLLTWLIKLLVVRYGGLNAYRKSLPLFFGIILGDAFAQITSGLIMSFLGLHGASPYLEIRW